MRTPASIAASLAGLRLSSVFNPYGEYCSIHDQPNAAWVRRLNLTRFLEAALDARVDTLWIARDLGYRGGRRTGIPLTDEVHLGQAQALLGGLMLRRATLGPVLAERTAAVVWRTLARIGEPVVPWNIFPLHPHDAGDPLSNRRHSRAEREATWHLLLAVINMVRPKRVVAIGRDAACALSGLALPLHVVRHPSYGGQAEFEAGISAIYGVEHDCGYVETPELPFNEACDTISPAAA